MRDALWAVRHDRLRTAREVLQLAGREAGEGALAAYLAIQQALSALDRLEVRGRDSAGIHVFVHEHGLDLADPARAGLDRAARAGPDVPVRLGAVVGGVLSFVYKAAAEIGELGDNTRALRAAVAGDQLLRRAVAVAVGRAIGARAHALGERRHHLRAQRPPDQQRRARGRPAARRISSPH